MYIPPKERLGLLIFVVLIICSHTFSSLYEKIYGHNEQERLLLLSQIIKNHKVPKKEYISKVAETVQINPLTQFDPNVINSAELIKYGVSHYAASNLEKYRKSGGIFKSKDDLYKIYGMDSSIMTSIKHLIKIPERAESQNVPRITKSKDVITSAPTQLVTNHLPTFDPNVASLDMLVKQGLSTYAANNLIKYRSKGGKLYEDTDLLKIYGVDSGAYQKVRPRIIISIDQQFDEDSTIVTTNVIKGPTKKVEGVWLQVDLNHADQDELMELRGIGLVLSQRIIKQRERLGGYHSVDQIKEIYGLTPETFDEINEHLTATGKIKKIYIPGMSFKEVLSHPYIDYETTKKVKNISLLIFDQKLQKLIEQGEIDERLLPYLHLTDPDVTVDNLVLE